MPFAHVVLDIPTRALSGTFDYAIPESLEETAVVGTTVLVPFSHRQVVGYVVGISDRVSSGFRCCACASNNTSSSRFSI